MWFASDYFLLWAEKKYMYVKNPASIFQINDFASMGKLPRKFITDQ